MNYRSTFSEIAILIIIILLTQVTPIGAVLSCTELATTEIDLLPESGQLLYIEKTVPTYTISSTSDRFSPLESIMYDNIALSPNGEWIVWTERNYHENSGTWTAEAVLQAVHGDDVYHIPLYTNQYRFPSGLHWIDDLEVLTTYVTAVHPPEFYYFSVFNPFTGELRYVHPFSAREVEATLLPSEPFYPASRPSGALPEGLSSDGRYIFYSECDFRECTPAIYDLVTRSVLDLQNIIEVHSPIWSSSSTRLIYREPVDQTAESSVVRFYTYDLTSDTTELAFEMERESEERIYITSWSPNEDFLVISRGQGTNLESYHLAIIDFVEQEITDTCFGETQDISWSRDSRYLALYGQLEGEERETGSVYIYDTVEGQIYEVYHGAASVVGWAASPE